MQTLVPNLLTSCTDRLAISFCTLPEKVTGEAKILNIDIVMKMGFVDCVLVQSFFLNAAYKKKKKKKKAYATNISI